MESLLSLSFDYLSSRDGGKIRKGLRQVEGLLAQICLSGSSNAPQQDRRRSVAWSSAKEQTPKELSELKDDPAFWEFFKLQQGFQWNGLFEPANIGKNYSVPMLMLLFSCNEIDILPRTTPRREKQSVHPAPSSSNMLPAYRAS